MAGNSSSRRRRRLWRFAGAEFDEAGWMLRVDAKPVPLEGKPLEILHELLLRAGEVVTKEELLDAVWPGVAVVEGSVPTAVSKLRKAIGDSDDAVIETVPRVGYRLAAPVTFASLDAPLAPRFAFAAGDAVPQRPQWRLDRPLGDSGANDVWLARHRKTGQARVFKFADAPDRLRGLKREAALARLIQAGLGQAAPCPALLEWNFDAPPYFLEYSYGGVDLTEWAASAGGLAAIPLDQRLKVAAMAARSLAAIHDLGVLHKDLKPANILLEQDGDELVVRLADFGSGRLLDDGILAGWAITDPGSLGPGGASDDDRSGTAAYRAPELVGGSIPTAKSDIYALGLVAFQLIVADFKQGFAPGWEQRVEDPVLRGDIASAAAGNPDERIAHAAELADRIERLEERRALAGNEAADRMRLAELQAAEDRRALRRPWLRAAIAASVLGLIGTSAAASIAFQQLNRARASQSIAEASYSFLADDLLAKADPAEATATDETMGQALKRASREIDQRFAKAPWIAARLHQSMGRALAERADYAGARQEFDGAEALFAKAGDREGRGVVAYQRALMLARSVEEHSLGEARASFAQAVKSVGHPDRLVGEPAMWGQAAAGYLAIAEGQAANALTAFEKSARSAKAMTRRLSPREQIALQQRMLHARLRLDQMPRVERDGRALARQANLLLGPDHPDTLQVRLNVAQALLAQQKNEAMIAEATGILPLIDRRYGRDHPRTLQLLGSRMDAFKNLERYREARLDGERMWRSAERRFGARSFYAVGSRLDTARVRCRDGDTRGGLEDALAAYRWAVEGFGNKHALTHGVSHGVADCLIASGRHREAKAYLQGLDRRAVGELVGNKLWGQHVELLLAEIAAKTGDLDAARKHFDAAKPAFEDLLTDGYELRRIRSIERSLIRA